MAKFKHWKCPDCGGVFSDLQVRSDDPPPDRCKLCGSWMNLDAPPQEAFVPQAPGIRKSAYAASVDQSYRAMEETSAQRAEEAAGMLEDAYRAEDRESPFESDPTILKELQKHQVDEVRSTLKVTNMQDPSSMRPGDNAVVGGNAGAAAARLSMGGNIPGPRFANDAGAVPMPAAGSGNNANFVSGFTRDHHQRAVGMIRAGELGRAKI